MIIKENKQFIIPFFKMHGLGNDYIYVELHLLDTNLRKKILDNKISIIQSLSKYHYGIGSDGLIFLDFKNNFYEIEMYNKDGSYSQICGNGFRCIGGYLYLNYLKQNQFFIISGSKKIEVKIEIEEDQVNSINQFNLSNLKVWVNMGNFKDLNYNLNEEVIQVDQYIWKYRYVNMGNPHCVIFLNNNEILSDLNLNYLGPKIEQIFSKKGFEDGINIEWIQVVSESEMIQRTWERGSGETLACGSGASAAFVSGILLKTLSNNVICKLLGGDLYLSLKDDYIWQNGKIEYLFNGYYFYDNR